MGFGNVKIDKNELLLSKNYGATQYIKKGTIINCLICKKEVYSSPSTSIRKKFCSVKCRTLGKKPKPKIGNFIKCTICDNQIWITQSRVNGQNKYCSKKCLSKKEKTGSTLLKCKYCNCEYLNYKSQIELRGSSYCSMVCMKKDKKENFVKRKKKNKSSNGLLKKQLWIYFSKYIRQRDKGICISCGKIDDWKNTDAGHYIPKTAGLSIYFEEKNVHCQCTGCNRFRHGNLSNYAIALRKKYGETILEDLDRQKNKTIKISDYEYEQLIIKYKEKIRDNGFMFS